MAIKGNSKSHQVNPHPRVSDVDVGVFDYARYAWEHIRVELMMPQGIAVVYLDRPEKYNTFTGAMCASLVFAFELFDADDRVKVAVLTGTGKAFCAGADLSSGFGAVADHAQGHRDGGGQTALSILRCRKPSIAAINGNSIGIGMTMTLACDFRLVSSSAKVAIPFTKRGIAMEATSSFLLPKLVGVTKAIDIILSGDTRSPDDASYSALWSRSPLPQDQVLPEALKLAKNLAQNSSVSMALCKAQIWRQVSSPEEAHLLESQGIWETSRLDGVEGIKSFMEKRDAQFKGTMHDLERFALWPWWTQADVSKGVQRGPEAMAKSKL